MEKVSVVIPSYNRGHIIKKVIPSYFQEEVGEVIIIDDCSKDNTKDVVEELKCEFKNLRYYRLDKNSGQCIAKNLGIEKAKYEFIYFGDDDSYISRGTIKYLYETLLTESDVLMVGARAVYLNEYNKVLLKPKKILFDIEDNLYTNWELGSESLKEVPFLPACSLMRTSVARKILFDPIYKGNGFREETDFSLRVKKLGGRLLYNSKGVQTNLPRKLSTGGAHSIGRLKYEYFAIRNTAIFYHRHWRYLQKEYKLSKNIVQMMLLFVISRIKGLINGVLKK